MFGSDDDCASALSNRPSRSNTVKYTRLTKMSEITILLFEMGLNANPVILFAFLRPLLHLRDVSAQRQPVYLAITADLLPIDYHIAVVLRCRFGMASVIIGLLYPAIQSFPHLDKRLLEFRISGQVARLVRVGLHIVQLFFGSRWREEQFFGEHRQLALCVQLTQSLDDLFRVLVRVGLQVRAQRIEVANILKAFGADAANSLNGFVAAVARGKDRVARHITFGKDVAPLHLLRYFEASQAKRDRGHVDMFDKIVAHPAARDARAAYDKRNVNPAGVEKLLLARVTDPVIGHEDDDGLVENAFPFQTRDYLTDLFVGITHRVQVLRPVVEQHGIARIIG